MELQRRSSGAVSRSGSRETSDPPTPTVPAWLEACTTVAESAAEQNGLISEENLCKLPTGGLHLRADAARAWWRLSRRYKHQFGEPHCATDAGRSLDALQRLYAAKPGLAARPGTSIHGWGMSVHLCGGAESFDNAQHAWLRENAVEVGWTSPGWAQQPGSKPEPWQREFSPVPSSEE